jgi:hypothetical protein
MSRLHHHTGSHTIDRLSQQTIAISGHRKGFILLLNCDAAMKFTSTSICQRQIQIDLKTPPFGLRNQLLIVHWLPSNFLPIYASKPASYHSALQAIYAALLG